jgi:hypothetical protein
MVGGPMKKVQYLIVDSEFVIGTNNNFSVNFDITSNTFIEDMREVIGIKVVDFYVTQIGESGDGRANQAKFIDIVCPDVPMVAQMLSERTGTVLCRVPLERSFNGSAAFVVHDKQWKSFTRETKYFNPISIQKLSFQLYEHQGDGDYVPLQPDAEFYMVLEITTRDATSPPEDTNLRVVEAIEKLGEKFDLLAHSVRNPPPPPKKKTPLSHVVIIILLLFGIGFMIMRSMRSSPATAVPAPTLPTPLPVPIRAPGASRLL